VFLAQEREITLTWPIAEKYIGHISAKGHNVQGYSFQQKNTI
jgi:hypothetical protein